MISIVLGLFLLFQGVSIGFSERLTWSLDIPRTCFVTAKASPLTASTRLFGGSLQDTRTSSGEIGEYVTLTHTFNLVGVLVCALVLSWSFCVGVLCCTLILSMSVKLICIFEFYYLMYHRGFVSLMALLQISVISPFRDK